MDSTFGKYANGKFIPEWVKYIPHEYKVSFLCGYLDTDGCCYAVNGKKLYTIEYTSCNLKLLESVQDILFSIGIFNFFPLLFSVQF